MPRITWLLAAFYFAISVTSASRDHMTSAVKSHHSGRGAAKAALLALTSALRASNNAYDGAAILPDTSPSPLEKVALELISIPKPVFCGAEIRGRVLLLECRHVTPPNGVTYHHQDGVSQKTYDDWLAEDVAEDLEVVRRTHGSRGGEPTVLIQGFEDFLILTLVEFEEWLRDYRYLIAVSSAIFEADIAEARTHGASLMYRVGPGGMPLR